VIYSRKLLRKINKRSYVLYQTVTLLMTFDAKPLTFIITLGRPSYMVEARHFKFDTRSDNGEHWLMDDKLCAWSGLHYMPP